MTSIEPLAAEHFALVARWLAEPAIHRWLTAEWRGRPVDTTVVAMAARNKRNRLFLVRHDGTPCGLVGLSDVDTTDGCAMVWYALGERGLGGKGITSDAVNLACRLGFRELRLAAINAWIMRGNEASRRVLKRNGFREAGVLRDAAVLDGERVDRVYFDVTPGELAPATGAPPA